MVRELRKNMYFFSFTGTRQSRINTVFLWHLLSHSVVLKYPTRWVSSSDRVKSIPHLPLLLLNEKDNLSVLKSWQEIGAWKDIFTAYFSWHHSNLLHKGVPWCLLVGTSHSEKKQKMKTAYRMPASCIYIFSSIQLICINHLV